MKISIIIPVYNVVAYLRQCVQSVLAQTYQDIEIILVDDGSTDDSGTLCDSLAEQDNRICVIHQSNQGLSGARNTGLRQATGDYIAFLDGDDIYMLTDGIERLMKILEKTFIDVLLFQCVDIYSNQQTIRKAYDTAYISTHSATEVFEYLVRSQSLNMSACFQLLRREFLLQNNLFFEVGLLSEDVDWTLRLWRYAQQVNAINIPMYGYQHREGSITTTYTIRNLRSYDCIFNKFKAQYATELEEGSMTELVTHYWKTTLGYLAQMYTSCLYGYNQITHNARNEAMQILRTHKDLLQYSISRKSNRVVLCNRFVGLRLTIWLFALYGSLKRYLYS